MGRTSTAQGLTAEQNIVLDDCIRRHRFVDINAINKDLVAIGINYSRTALHRHMQKLAIQDALHAGTKDDTVIIVIERSTGSTTSITTTASKQMIVALISGLKAPA